MTNKKNESDKPPKKKVGMSKSTQKSSKYPVKNTRTSQTSTPKTIAESNIEDYELVTYQGQAWNADYLLATARKAESYKAACVDLLLNLKDMRATTRNLRSILIKHELGEFATTLELTSNIMNSSSKTSQAPTTSETTAMKTYKNTYDFKHSEGITLNHDDLTKPEGIMLSRHVYSKNTDLKDKQDYLDILQNRYTDKQKGILPEGSGVRFHVDSKFKDEPQKSKKLTYYFDTKTGKHYTK